MQVPIYPGRGSWPDWNNPDILQRNRLPAHAAFVPYPDQNSCRNALEMHRRYLSPHVLSLKEDWDYRYYASLIQLPENILSFRSGFEKRPVPETAPIVPSLGHFNGLPFPLDPPRVFSDQPVLVYRKTFQLPLLWSNLRKRLVLYGVRSACHVFVNGKCAGYTQGSGLQAEFDITGLLHDGDNELFLFVYPYNCGSYLEEQPASPWFGCIREVILEAVPSLFIQDVQVETTWLSEEEAWRLDLGICLASCRIAVEQPLVHASLRYQDHSLYEAGWTVAMRPADAAHFAAPVQTTGQLNASLLIQDVIPWCDENPVLYDLYISIEDRHGRDLMCVHQLIGFRSLSCREGCLLVNGREVRLKAVRWSLLDEADSVCDIGDLISNLRTYKQKQINAIWFQHIPPDPIVLDLCDIYGFYVIEDAPLDPKDPTWIRTLKQMNQNWPYQWAEDRLLRLVHRDKNHPSMIAWSCGLFLKEDLDEASSHLRQQLMEQVGIIDHQRLFHGPDIPNLGRFLDTWLSSDKLPSDLSWLRLPEEDEPGWCLLEHDSPPELLQSIGHLLQPLGIRPINPIIGSFQVVNRQAFNGADLFRLSWDLLKQGQPILSGELDSLMIDPGESQLIEIWYGNQDFTDGSDYLIRVTIRQSEENIWMPKGYEVGHEEFLLQKEEVHFSPPTGHGGRLRLESERHHLIVSGSRFWFVFNRIFASLDSWRAGEQEFLAARSGQASKTSFLQIIPQAGLRLNLMRQPEPFDGPDWHFWARQGYDSMQIHVLSVEEGCDGKTAVIEMMAHLGVAGQRPLFRLALRYEVYAQGILRLFASLTPNHPDVFPPPCFSFCFNPASPYRFLSWYGNGPDRQPARLTISGMTGYYDQSLSELAKPERSSGLFRDVRRLIVCDDGGSGLTVSSDHLFAFDAWPISSQQTIRSGPDLISDPTRVSVQIIHQASLACRPFIEPMKLMLEFKPLT